MILCIHVAVINTMLPDKSWVAKLSTFSDYLAIQLTLANTGSVSMIEYTEPIAAG